MLSLVRTHTHTHTHTHIIKLYLLHTHSPCTQHHTHTHTHTHTYSHTHSLPPLRNSRGAHSLNVCHDLKNKNAILPGSLTSHLSPMGILAPMLPAHMCPWYSPSQSAITAKLGRW